MLVLAMPSNAFDAVENSKNLFVFATSCFKQNKSIIKTLKEFRHHSVDIGMLRNIL